jgi:CBS domain-containing protein
MWWPALGAVVVGVIGYFAPRTLGVGYENISDTLSGNLTLTGIAFLCTMKFVSWAVALGSGTSGGTLAPLFTVGSGLGALLGVGAATLLPMADVDPHVAALVGMAAIFAGASRALLTSAVFAFETTLQPLGLMPLLGGCAAAYLVSSLLMKHTIMTERIARRGVLAPSEYVADLMDHVHVRDIISGPAITIRADQTLEEVRNWLSSSAPGTSYQGYPVVNAQGVLTGVVTRKDLSKTDLPGDRPVAELIHRLVKYVYDDSTVRQAADHMVNHGIGRLPVVRRDNPRELLGMITRSDLLSVYRRRVDEARRESPTIRMPLARDYRNPAAKR